MTPARAGFMHHDLGEEWERRLELSPDPDGDHFTGRILETLDLVEDPVIQSSLEGLNGLLDVAIVDQKALIGIDVPLDDHLNAERVAVHAPTLVPLGKTRKKVSGFEAECFDQSNMHR